MSGRWVSNHRRCFGHCTAMSFRLSGSSFQRHRRSGHASDPSSWLSLVSLAFSNSRFDCCPVFLSRLSLFVCFLGRCPPLSAGHRFSVSCPSLCLCPARPSTSASLSSFGLVRSISFRYSTLGLPLFNSRFGRRFPALTVHHHSCSFLSLRHCASPYPTVCSSLQQFGHLSISLSPSLFLFGPSVAPSLYPLLPSVALCLDIIVVCSATYLDVGALSGLASSPHASVRRFDRPQPSLSGIVWSCLSDVVTIRPLSVVWPLVWPVRPSVRLPVHSGCRCSFGVCL